MERVARDIRKLGYKVIVPQPSHIRYGHKPEVLKDKYDLKTLTKWEGEGAFAHLDNIRKSDIVYIFNKNAYLGPAVTVEIGFALALKKPILSYAKVKDITVTNFVSQILPPAKLIVYLKKVYNN
ncbi:MAG: MazG nucleotide pyrophosphohydrolase [Candidatus Gottesmanbacteria bacterium GW2011_GWA2_43_14]|uniref:MazG nucleotide pyrophosphohydrolase n=1 Tax=Candidatus Gottesmanbacteria bacterium GW2011_GWA2_43_14 TaxID=1618443 RepID=A0A0G1G9M4_9BACT|nr:MAG: MazG nucleotide pyrophosphohydrolase [Candidatus Gottesmanbacteria bacterium GW2011_GWA2_43_14]